MVTNNNNLPLSLSVFLAHDEYPEHREGVISVTTLLKPIKQIVLGMRISGNQGEQDISGRIASTFGTAIHNGIENAWCSPRLPDTLKELGYPKGMIERVRVNPSQTMLDDNEDIIPVYTELRTEKEFMGWIISGEFDFVAEGRVRDFKTTGVYTYIKQTNSNKYILQGSLYRWLNPSKITDSVMAIDYIFTDWSALNARTQKDTYPPTRMMEQIYELLPIPKAEEYVKDKLNLIDKFRLADQSEIPKCTNEDLWVDPSKFKYYKKIGAARATRVYDTAAEANSHFIKDGSVGAVIEHKGTVKACRYCEALPICDQANAYINSGELTL